MAETPVRWQFVSVVLMSISLGAILLVAFESWLRGDSFVWVTRRP
jgi:hypothetical protein